MKNTAHHNWYGFLGKIVCSMLSCCFRNNRLVHSKVVGFYKGRYLYFLIQNHPTIGIIQPFLVIYYFDVRRCSYWCTFIANGL